MEKENSKKNCSFRRLSTNKIQNKSTKISLNYKKSFNENEESQRKDEIEIFNKIFNVNEAIKAEKEFSSDEKNLFYLNQENIKEIKEVSFKDGNGINNLKPNFEPLNKNNNKQLLPKKKLKFKKKVLTESLNVEIEREINLDSGNKKNNLKYPLSNENQISSRLFQLLKSTRKYEDEEDEEEENKSNNYLPLVENNITQPQPEKHLLESDSTSDFKSVFLSFFITTQELMSSQLNSNKNPIIKNLNLNSHNFGFVYNLFKLYIKIIETDCKNKNKKTDSSLFSINFLQKSVYPKNVLMNNHPLNKFYKYLLIMMISLFDFSDMEIVHLHFLLLKNSLIIEKDIKKVYKENKENEFFLILIFCGVKIKENFSNKTIQEIIKQLAPLFFNFFTIFNLKNLNFTILYDFLNSNFIQKNEKLKLKFPNLWEVNKFFSYKEKSLEVSNHEDDYDLNEIVNQLK